MSSNYWNPDTSAQFKEFWVDPYGASMKEPFEDIEPALSFGWDHALMAEYPGETWEEVEDELQRGWKETHQVYGVWSEMKEHVRNAWTKARADWQGLASKIKQG